MNKSKIFQNCFPLLVIIILLKHNVEAVDLDHRTATLPKASTHDYLSIRMHY